MRIFNRASHQIHVLHNFKIFNEKIIVWHLSSIYFYSMTCLHRKCICVHKQKTPTHSISIQFCTKYTIHDYKFTICQCSEKSMTKRVTACLNLWVIGLIIEQCKWDYCFVTIKFRESWWKFAILVCFFFFFFALFSFFFVETWNELPNILDCVCLTTILPHKLAVWWHLTLKCTEKVVLWPV